MPLTNAIGGPDPGGFTRRERWVQGLGRCSGTIFLANIDMAIAPAMSGLAQVSTATWELSLGAHCLSVPDCVLLGWYR